MTFMPPLTSHLEATAHLCGDPVMREVVLRNGVLSVLTPTADPFGTLIRNVAGQQLSVRAAASIYDRLVERLAEQGGQVDARSLLQTPGDNLRGVGLSWAKVRTVKAIAEGAHTGTIDFAHLATLSDEEIIAQLTPLPGIGRWTAEMFLMFALARPDVFSLGDLALRQGLTRLYPEHDPQEVLIRWQPYRTLAARYIWADNARHRAGGVPL